MAWAAERIIAEMAEWKSRQDLVSLPMDNDVREWLKRSDIMQLVTDAGASPDALAGLRMSDIDHDTLDAVVMLGLQELSKQTSRALCEEAIEMLQAELDQLQLESTEVAGT